MPDIFVKEEPKKEELDLPIEEVSANAKNLSRVPMEIKSTKHSHFHLFSSYCENPPNIGLSEKLEHEEILLFLRKHFITNVLWMIKAFIASLIPLLFLFINSVGILPINFLPIEYRIIILLAYYFLVAEYIFTSYLTWFYNISLVTTERILDIDFSSIVFENVAATKLSLVEDVSYQQVGVLRSIFDYGDVFVQTAGESREFDFLAVPHPERVIKVINSLTGGHHKQ